MKKQGWILVIITIVFACLLVGIFLWRYFDYPDAATPTAVPTTLDNTTKTDSIEPININTATIQELQQVPGIGPALAEKIVDYRAEHGNFTNIEQLFNISGINESSFIKISPYITIE